MSGMRHEDYIRAIYELSREKGYTRVKEISSELGVKPSSVTEMLKKLSDMGYVLYVKRLFVRLTDKGQQEAERIIERHKTLVKFLRVIGVPEDVALKDACVIEHTLHPVTVRQLKNFVKFIENSPRGEPIWLSHFWEFCETGNHSCTRHLATIPFDQQENINQKNYVR
ncbi:metal-dependent transcriptional regulator [Geoglobus ahangari]